MIRAMNNEHSGDDVEAEIPNLVEMQLASQSTDHFLPGIEGMCRPITSSNDKNLLNVSIKTLSSIPKAIYKTLTAE